MQVSEAIGRALAGRGVEVFFGLVGSGNFALTNALHAAGAEFYSARHEGGAVMMADGYARSCVKVGVVSVHQGPGFTNSLTGLTEAAKNRTPMLVLAADMPAETFWSNFKIDQGALATVAGAIVERVRGAKTAAEDAARALRRAQVERRPVVLSIPINLVEMSADDSSEGISTTLIGMLSTTGRRSTCVRLSARAASSAAVFAPRTRSTIAPAAVARAPWSILKFDQNVSTGISAASTNTGVRFFAASASPVSELVKPGP